MNTKQLQAWTTDFGRAYTDRNPSDIDKMDAEFGGYRGVGLKSNLFRRFLGRDRLASGKVLEVGSNIGVQLKILQKVNPDLQLYGLEPQAYALEKGKNLFPDIHFTPGNAFAIPFADNTFDVVMTNTVLIHIHPDDRPRALAEILRVSRRYVHFHEYYAHKLVEVRYRGHEGLLWKDDFIKSYQKVALENGVAIQVADVQLLEYKDPETGDLLTDQVALLEKG